MAIFFVCKEMSYPTVLLLKNINVCNSRYIKHMVRIKLILFLIDNDAM